MPRRLTLAFALSLAVHGAALLPDFLKRLPAAPPKPPLQAMLRLAPAPEPLPAEPLLKNTLDEEVAPKEVDPPPPPPPPKPVEPAPKPVPKNTQKRDVQIAQRKLSEHQFYPPEAVAQNLEGEVVLILKLSDNGTIEDVSVGASSGHRILDNAAVRNAYAVGAFDDVSSRELVVRMYFRLE